MKFIFSLLLVFSTLSMAAVVEPSIGPDNISHSNTMQMDCCAEQVHADCAQCYPVADLLTDDRHLFLAPQLRVVVLPSNYRSITTKILSPPPII